MRQRDEVDGAELVAVLAGSRAAGIAGMVRRPEGRGGGYWGEELGLGSRGRKIGRASCRKRVSSYV